MEKTGLVIVVMGKGKRGRIHFGGEGGNDNGRRVVAQRGARRRLKLKRVYTIGFKWELWVKCLKKGQAEN